MGFLSPLNGYMATRLPARVWDWLYAAQLWRGMGDASGLNQTVPDKGPFFVLLCRRSIEPPSIIPKNRTLPRPEDLRRFLEFAALGGPNALQHSVPVRRNEEVDFFLKPFAP